MTFRLQKKLQTIAQETNKPKGVAKGNSLLKKKDLRGEYFWTVVT